jgi:uncharacterized membrane-anchored protein
MRNLILLVTAAAVLFLVNYSIWQRERLVTDGRSVYLELAPVDPRSLMQGDYLALRFKVAADLSESVAKASRDGRLVLGVDRNRVGTFRRFSDAAAPAADEALLRYRVRNREVKLATNAFFFQEGDAPLYRGVKYGEFKLSPDGEAILVALRGAERQLLGRSEPFSR